MVDLQIKVTKGGSREFFILLKELSKIGGKYNKEFMEACADNCLTNKYGMIKRAFGEEADPATGEKWKSLSESWQKVRAANGREANSNKLQFGKEFKRGAKRGQGRWIESGNLGLRKSIQRSEYNNGAISVGTNDPKGSSHQTDGAGRGKVVRKFLGLGKKDYEIFNILFEKKFKEIVREAKASAE